MKIKLTRIAIILKTKLIRPIFEFIGKQIILIIE